MNTAIPLAVADRKIEPSRDSAAIRITPAIRATPGPTGSSGHQPPETPVITIAAV